MKSKHGDLQKSRGNSPYAEKRKVGEPTKAPGVAGTQVNDVFSVGNLYRIDLLQEAGKCVAEVFMGNAAPDTAPIRLALGMNAPCYVRRWSRNEPIPTDKQRRELGSPMNSIGGAQVWEIPIDGTKRRVFAIVGDCENTSDSRDKARSVRLRCGKRYRKIMELDGTFHLSRVYGSPVETCAMKQEEEIVGFWVSAGDP